MNSTTNEIVARFMNQFEAIANRLERGEISPEEADTESKLVQAALDREIISSVNASLAARTFFQALNAATIPVGILIALVLLGLYFKHSGAA
jgi:hypothetical protein